MMKKIILVFDLDEKKLEHILGASLVSGSSRFYMKFKYADGPCVKKLTSSGFYEIDFPRHDEQYKEKFLREYVDHVGRIGKENNTLVWWATDIASKNRFTSRLPVLLDQFLITMETARTREFDVLVILNPDWTICTSLAKACQELQIKCIVTQGFRKRRWLGLLSGRLRGLAAAIFNIGRISFRAVACRIELGKKIQALLKKTEVFYVVKTFVYNSSFSDAHGYKDAFFGRLPDLLAKEREVLILATVLGNFRKCLREIKKCDSAYIIPIEFFVNLKDYFFAFRMFLSADIKVAEEKNFFDYDVSGIINNELQRSFNGIQFYQLMHYWFVKRFLRNVRPESFLLTYENNPWEKMCIRAVRELSPQTKIMGYQHTIVSQASANMFRSRFDKDSRLFPDKILTVGEAPKRIIQRYGDSPYGWVNATCGLRFEYLFGRPELERKKRGNILIALEGIKEVESMVSFVIQALHSTDKYRVRIRTHPVLRWKYFQKRGLNIAGKESFQLSETTPLMEDLEWADVVTYWGSTVALEALSLGLPVVHYQNSSLLSLDPLFECGHLKWNVSEGDSFVRVLDQIFAMDDAEFFLQRQMAQDYLKEYFLPINEMNIRYFVDKAEIKTG